MRIIKKSIVVLVLFALSVSLSFVQKTTTDNIPQTLNELQDSIQKVLVKNNISGGGIIMVSGDSIVLLSGFGKSDIEKTDKDIDQMVYELYGLTEDEIKIVKEAV